MKFAQPFTYLISIALVALYICGMRSAIPDTRNHETIRNIYFHVPMWFGMMVFLSIGFYYSLRYLRSYDMAYDAAAFSFSTMGILYGTLGLATGMVWASATWGSAWNNDPKQLGAAIALLTYIAYLILRMNIKDPTQRARISGIYSIFAYFILFPTIWILPRMTQSLHPGGLHDGEVIFDTNNINARMRLIMWLLAIPAWIGLGYWIAHTRFRALRIQFVLAEKDRD